LENRVSAVNGAPRRFLPLQRIAAIPTFVEDFTDRGLQVAQDFQQSYRYRRDISALASVPSRLGVSEL
jgi:hypothetical protein